MAGAEAMLLCLRLCLRVFKSKKHVVFFWDMFHVLESGGFVSSYLFLPLSIPLLHDEAYNLRLPLYAPFIFLVTSSTNSLYYRATTPDFFVTRRWRLSCNALDGWEMLAS